MKRLILILILILSFQSGSKADDIRDFEIEGMSIGDSLLEYVSKKKIDKTKIYFETKKYGIKEEYSKIFIEENLKQFDYIAIYFRSKDTNYIIHSLSGRIEFKKNINECYKLQKNIAKEVRSITANTIESKDEGKMSGYSGKRTSFDFEYKDYSGISITCYDYKGEDDKFDYTDRLSLFAYSSEYGDFLNNRAQK